MTSFFISITYHIAAAAAAVVMTTILRPVLWRSHRLHPLKDSSSV